MDAVFSSAFHEIDNYPRFNDLKEFKSLRPCVFAPLRYVFFLRLCVMLFTETSHSNPKKFAPALFLRRILLKSFES
jgi:hypothetical protein